MIHCMHPLHILHDALYIARSYSVFSIQDHMCSTFPIPQPRGLQRQFSHAAIPLGTDFRVIPGLDVAQI